MMSYVSHLRETKNSYHYFLVCLWASHKEFAGFILLIKAPHERPGNIQRKKRRVQHTQNVAYMAKPYNMIG